MKYSALPGFADQYTGKNVAKSLDAAVQGGNLDIVELLVSKVKKFPLLNPWDCLCFAVWHNNEEIFSRMLPKVLAKINEPVCKSKHSLLHKAVALNRVMMTEKLLEAGSDINHQIDKNQCTPFVLAVVNAMDGRCGEDCCAPVIAELLRTNLVDLEATAKVGLVHMKASGIVTSATCPHVRELVEQAYSSIIPEQEKERQLEPFLKMESDGKVSTIIPLFAIEEYDDTSNEATEPKEESEGARNNEKGQEDGEGSISNNENKESMIDKK